jgi:hypothetical protein
VQKPRRYIENQAHGDLENRKELQCHC